MTDADDIAAAETTDALLAWGTARGWECAVANWFTTYSDLDADDAEGEAFSPLSGTFAGYTATVETRCIVIIMTRDGRATPLEALRWAMLEALHIGEDCPLGWREDTR